MARPGCCACGGLVQERCRSCSMVRPCPHAACTARASSKPGSRAAPAARGDCWSMASRATTRTPFRRSHPNASSTSSPKAACTTPGGCSARSLKPAPASTVSVSACGRPAPHGCRWSATSTPGTAASTRCRHSASPAFGNSSSLACSPVPCTSSSCASATRGTCSCARTRTRAGPKCVRTLPHASRRTRATPGRMRHGLRGVPAGTGCTRR